MFNKFLTVALLFLNFNAFAINFTEFDLKVPKEPPKIKFMDKDGKENTINDYDGKVILVNFWATWCKPCIEEMPDFERLQNNFSKEKFEVLPISIDFLGAEAVEKFYKNNNITNLPVLIDKTMKAYTEFDVNFLPSSFLIDKNGFIVSSFLGVHPWSSQEFINYIKKSLK